MKTTKTKAIITGCLLILTFLLTSCVPAHSQGYANGMSVRLPLRQSGYISPAVINPYSTGGIQLTQEELYCKAYQIGFKEGYCYNQGQYCNAPAEPTCPASDNRGNSTKAGYMRGFIDGMEANGK